MWKYCSNVLGISISGLLLILKMISLCDDPRQVIVTFNFLPQRFLYSVLAWFSVPLLSRVCPNDSYKIYKSGECFSRDVNCTYIFNRSVIHCWREFICPWLIINTERSQNWRLKRWERTIFCLFFIVCNFIVEYLNLAQEVH